MALKIKGVPKAGPKKRRAKSEDEAIRAAVDENSRRTVRAKRKAGKVHRYSYKDLEADRKRKRAQTDKEREDKLAFGLREPIDMTLEQIFTDNLPADQKVFAHMYWTMQCEHNDEWIAQTSSFVIGPEAMMVRCLDCGSQRKWWGTKTETKRQEWLSYCPDNVDMWEWSSLFVRDRSMWRFIHDEVLAEQREGVIA